MALSLHFSPLISAKIIEKPGLIGRECIIRKPNWITDAAHLSKRIPPHEALKVKAMENQPSTKPNSIICADCEGDGAKKCPQCEGSGVNSVDHFNGQFKAGGLCWLCRGKKEILCGNCNGAGFIGGFMSTFDD